MTAESIIEGLDRTQANPYKNLSDDEWDVLFKHLCAKVDQAELLARVNARKEQKA
jgi:hypothetical protein